MGLAFTFFSQVANVGEWQGECFGHACFTELASFYDDPVAQRKLKSLAELERVTGQRIAQALTARGIEPGLPEPLARFQEAAKQASAADRELADFIVAHEQALLDFFLAELAGGDDALQGLKRFVEGAQPG